MCLLRLLAQDWSFHYLEPQFQNAEAQSQNKSVKLTTISDHF